MATFNITEVNGTVHVVECDLAQAQKIKQSYGEGAELELVHPGTSGTGTSGIDY